MRIPIEPIQQELGYWVHRTETNVLALTVFVVILCGRPQCELGGHVRVPEAHTSNDETYDECEPYGYSTSLSNS